MERRTVTSDEAAAIVSSLSTRDTRTLSEDDCSTLQAYFDAQNLPGNTPNLVHQSRLPSVPLLKDTAFVDVREGTVNPLEHF